MKRGFLILVSVMFFFIGCKKNTDDDKNAIIKGKVYKYAIPIDSSLDNSGHYVYTWDFLEPVAGVQVWVESDPESKVPYKGADIQTYTNSKGEFADTIFLGQEADVNNITGYKYIEYADVRLFMLYKNAAGYTIFDIGGGLTLGMGKTLELPPVALTWFIADTSSY
ncbi:MAG: hypothetical protein PHE49_07205 [bacterium]|nr:hypothetical protein [bacterium]